MKKSFGVFSTCFLMALLLLAPFSYAAGSSEGGDTAAESDALGSSTTDDVDDSAVVSYPGSAGAGQVDCEDPSTFTTRKDRIKCRINNKGNVKATDESKVHESCRRLSATSVAASANQFSVTDCKAHYTKLYSDGCYDLPNDKKAECFRRAAGFRAASANTDDAPADTVNRGAAARKYVVSLLYELEERIERAVENDRLDADAAAEVIDFIVEIKEDILNGEGRDVVRPKLQELREQLKELRSSLDE